MLKWFSDIKMGDLAIVGGKGLNLALMKQAGIPVPDGFVVTTSAYQEYVRSQGLDKRIDELLEKGSSMEENSRAIQDLFRPEDVLDETKQIILESFRKIGSGRVAVRSSATLEDLPGMSFAGQYTTYLNVTESDLIEKMVDCWKSLWNLRAMEYRKRNGIETGFSHAVVVQTMVEASVSGVAFTANPMNGLRKQLVINASYGLGEAIVIGEVNPDQILVDRESGEILSQVIQEKKILYRYGNQGIVKENVNGKQATAPSLDVSMVERLTQLAEKVEACFGKPQDLEFAFDANGDLFIVQSRDITTLYPTDQLVQDGKLRAYMSAGTVLLGMKEPFTPLGYDLMSHMFPTIINVMTARKKNPLTNSFVSFAGNRIFVDMSYLLSSRFVAKQFANSFSGNDLPLKGVMEKMLEDYGKTFRHQGIHFRLPMGMLKYGISMGLGARQILKIPNDQRYGAMIEEGNRWYEEIKKEYEQVKTIEERLAFARHALVQAFRLSQAQAMYCLDVNKYIKIEKDLKKHFGNEYKVEVLAQSLPECITQTMTIRLNEYAKLCCESGQEPSSEDPEFKRILDVYGDRGNTELDFGTKRWREDPTYLLDLVRTYMTEGMYERNLASHKAKEEEALAMIEDVTKKLIDKVGKRKAEKFRATMINYRYGAAMREYPKYDIVRFLALARWAVQSIGQELVTAGELDEKNDIFFLHEDEILKGQNLKETVIWAKEEYDREMKRTTIPRMVLNNGHTYYTAQMLDPDAKVIQGMPLSVGIYEGNVRVVFDPRTTELKEGEILVTESTNPSWTPLFATAGALIMEYGGPMSHGGIVAREYGIPAVVGISSASGKLKNGQRVRVNGETGTVEIL